MFGLGNAATPLGIKAMEQLKKLNGQKDEPSRSMITFVALNTASVTLIPATVISIRMTYHSASPGEIIGTTFVASLIATISAIMIDRAFYIRRRKKEECNVRHSIFVALAYSNGHRLYFTAWDVQARSNV